MNNIENTVSFLLPHALVTNNRKTTRKYGIGDMSDASATHPNSTSLKPGIGYT